MTITICDCCGTNLPGFYMLVGHGVHCCAKCVELLPNPQTDYTAEQLTTIHQQHESTRVRQTKEG